MKNEFVPAAYIQGRELILDNLYHASSSVNFDQIVEQEGRLVPSKYIEDKRMLLLSGTSVYKGRTEISDTISMTPDWRWACDFARKTIFSIGKARALSDLCEEYAGFDSVSDAEEFRQRAGEIGFAVYPDIPADSNDVRRYKQMLQDIKNTVKAQIETYESLDKDERKKVDHAFAVIYGFSFTDVGDKNFGGEDSNCEMQVYHEVNLRKKLSHVYTDLANLDAVQEFLERLAPERTIFVKSTQAVDFFLEEVNKSQEVRITNLIN